MFFTIEQKAFAHALAQASTFVIQGNTIQMPILKTLRIDAEPGRLVIQAANDQIELDIESISHQHCLALGRTSTEANGHIDHQKHFPPSLN